MVRGRCRRSSSGSASSESASSRKARPSGAVGHERRARLGPHLALREQPQQHGQEGAGCAPRPSPAPPARVSRTPALGEAQQRVLEDGQRLRGDRTRERDRGRLVGAAHELLERLLRALAFGAARHAPHRRRRPHDRARVGARGAAAAPGRAARACARAAPRHGSPDRRAAAGGRPPARSPCGPRARRARARAAPPPARGGTG